MFRILFTLFLISQLLTCAIPADTPTKNINLEGTLRLALLGDPAILNPILSTDSSSAEVEGMLFEGLLRLDRDLNFQPLLAEKWSIKNHGLQYVFYLKKNVYWHDGQKFSADDVVFTFNKILDTKTNSVRRSNYIINGQPLRFQKISDYAVEVTLPEPFAPFLSSMTMPIIPRHIFEKEDINRSRFNRLPIGTGPFVFKKWWSGAHLILERNEKYHSRPALLKRIIFRVIPYTSTQLAALRRGEIDLSEIPAKDLPKFLKYKNLRVYTYDQMFYTYLGFNLTNKHFGNPLVRRAIAYAIDKEQLVAVVLNNVGTPAWSPCSPLSWAYSRDFQKYPYNPARSIQLLQRAGYQKKGDHWEKNGEPLKFILLINQGNREREKAALIIQQYLKAVDISMEIRVLEWSTLLKILNADQDPKDFDAVIIGWSLGFDPDCRSLWHSSEYPRGFNFIKYSNPLVDQWLDWGRRIVDQQKRKKIYQKIWRQITIDQPYYFLWYPKSITAVNKRIGGYDEQPGPLGLIEDITTVYLKK